MGFTFGSKVRDKITGFVGVVTAYCEWMNGCIQYGITPTKLKDGVPQDTCWLDEGQLQLVGKQKAQKKATDKAPGGPQSHPTRSSRPSLG